MLGRTWILAGAATCGALAALVLAPEPARAAKSSPMTQFTTNVFGKFKTSRKGKPTGNYQTGPNSLAFAGGFGSVTGRGDKYRSVNRGFAFAATVDDLESRTDFPVTAPVSLASFNSTDTRGLPPPFGSGQTITVKNYTGTGTTLVITSYKQSKPNRKGEVFATIKGTVSGTIPVFFGGGPNLELSNGKFVVKVEVDPN